MSSSTAFALAAMSPLIRRMTVGLFALPLLFLGGALLGRSPMAIPGVLLVALYAWIWLRFRPTRFELSPESLDVVWPMKHVSIPRSQIREVRLVDRDGLREELGRRVRIGAGGLWGGFGWLWTRRRGLVQLYVSRTDGMVWIERTRERPWLITPEDPEDFVRALSPGPGQPRMAGEGQEAI